MAVVEFGAGQGGRVYVEVADQDDGDGLVRAGAGDRVVRAAAQTWNGALSGIRAAAEGSRRRWARSNPHLRRSR
ncbi:hypothetical protein ACFQQB_59455 [Nonomuraea rubra]|uniref:hypothetical protein n=1 Tax=Nonomuraea rubra TaxID=46180 RepID=UPI00361C83DA